jgi:KipI family sensor histidine kinase inhibitor
MPQHLTIHLAGENALIIYFSQEDDGQLSANVSAKVQQAEQLIRKVMAQELAHELSKDILDLVPSYASLMVMFNMITTDHHQVRNKLRSLLQTIDQNSTEQVITHQANLVELPVYYSHESGPDLSVIAQRAQLTVEQVIELHQAQEYRVYAIGFAPGFAYLGEVDERIAAPRLSTPRMKVPKGAVAIADRQTAVYPSLSPGGWNLIGLCPINMFDAKASPSMPVNVGDRVKFTAISKDEFLKLGGVLEVSYD